MNALFRRSASIAPSASRQTLAALLRLIPSEPFTSSSICAPDRFHGSTGTNKGGACEIRSRDFHFGTKSLEFRASDVARAGYAVEESFYDEEKVSSSSKKGGDEGLEIAKLGISQTIVSHLEKRGISKLFPIQVMIYSLLAFELLLKVDSLIK